MQHDWKLRWNWLARAVTLVALLVLIRGAGHAQSLAFQPGFVSVVAGEPENVTGTIASTASYVGPASGWLPGGARSSYSSPVWDKYGNMYILSQYEIGVIASGAGPIPALPSVTSPVAGYVYTVAGTGVSSTGSAEPLSSSCTTNTDSDGDGCLATQALVTAKGPYTDLAPANITVDSNGNIYFADFNNCIVRAVYAAGTVPGLTSPTPGYVYAISGAAGFGVCPNESGIGGLATSAEFYNPQFVAVDSYGNIYITDLDALGNKNQYTPLLAIYAGGANNPGLPGITNPAVGYIYSIVGGTTLEDGISASASTFEAPGAPAFDSYGNIYVPDNGSSIYEVRVIYVGGSVPGLSNNPTPGSIYKVAGGVAAETEPLAFTSTLATSAHIYPTGVAFDAAGSLYIADSHSNDVDRIDPSGNLTVVWGPAADAVYSCAAPIDRYNDGCAADATSYGVGGVGLDSQGDIYAGNANVATFDESNVAASSLYFTLGQTQPVVIYNTSSSTTALTLSDIAVTSPFELGTVSGSVTGCSTATTLQPGESCELEIEFPSTSTAAANATGTLTVTSNSTNATDGANTIQLTGESSLLPTLVDLESALPISITAGTTESLEFLVACNNSCTTATVFPTGTLTLYDNGSPLASVTPLTVNESTDQGADYTFTNVVLPTGANFVYAVYGGDSNYAGSQSYQTLVTVNGTASTTTLSTSASTVITNQTFTLTANVSPSSATGNVTFKSGSTVLGTGTLSGGTTSITTSFASVGTDSITAVYSGDDTYNTSTATPVTVTVSAPVNTTTAVASSLTSIGENSPVTLTATVAPASGTTAPTGTVTFSYTLNGTTTTLGSGNLTASGTNLATASYPTSALPEGTDSITAVYTPSTSSFVTSTSTNALSITVGAPATTTTLSASPTSITEGGSIALTATVAAQAGSTVPTGSVTFTAGSTTLGNVELNSNGVAQLTTSAIPGGTSTVTETVTALYSGATSPAFASSTGTATVSVTPLATTTTLSSSTLSPAAGVNVILTASVADTGGVTPTGTVNFYSGTTLLGSAALNSSGTGTYTTSLSQGTASLTAVYVGGNGFITSTSSALTLVVAAPPAATATTLSASPTSLSTGQSVTFTATVTNTSGTGTTPNGEVTFLNGSATLGTGQLSSNGQATFTLTPQAAATYSVTAQYQGNTNFTGSTSSPAVTVTVSTALAQSSTALSLSSSSITVGQPVTFTATVASASTSVTITPTGTVSFYNGTTLLGGPASLNGGTATYSTTALGAGSYSVTAQYSGDSNFAGSNSTAAALTVAALTPSFTLVSTPTNLTIQSGQSGQAVITLTPTASYAGTVALSCGTLPANVTCSFSSATLTADGNNDAVQSVLTIATNGAASTTARMDGAGRNGSVQLAALLFLPSGLLLWGFATRRRRRGWYLPVLVFGLLTVGLIGVSGCGGGSGGSSTDASAGTSTITITGTGSAGSQTQTVNLSVTITQ